MDTNSRTERFFSTKELADRWGISTQTVRRFMRRTDNPLRPVRIGKNVRFDPVEVDRFLKASQVVAA